MQQISRPTNQDDIDSFASFDDDSFSDITENDMNFLETNQGEIDFSNTTQNDKDTLATNQDDTKKFDVNNPIYLNLPLPDNVPSHNLPTDKKLVSMEAEKLPQPITKFTTVREMVRRLETIKEESLETISPAASSIQY